MLRSTFQSGFLSIFYSLGSDPLQIWTQQVRGGKIEFVEDSVIDSKVLELTSSSISSTFISCPSCSSEGLGIKLPIFVMIVKNLDKYFSFEVEIIDDRSVVRHFRANTFQAAQRVKPYICTMPLLMDEGWNQVQMDLNDLCRRAYNTTYKETKSVMVHANCRLRRAFFAERICAEDEFPTEFRLYYKRASENSENL
ncbi:hypothetical protein ACOME3_002671 [Neoechinorhynchus agilis]